MTKHEWKPTAKALCSCGESPSGYSLPTDQAQWGIWEVWHREHEAGSSVPESQSDVDSLRKRTEEQADVIDRLTKLIRDIYDEEECWYDHHGGCQAHRYLSLNGATCPQAEAKAIVSAYRLEDENE